MPRVVIMSNPLYIGNLANILKILKEIDNTLWMRCEVFGSIFFLV